MSLAPLRTWSRLQALAWLPLLVAWPWLSAVEVEMPWAMPLSLVMALSFFSLVVLLRAWRTAADLLTLFRATGLIVVVGSLAPGFGLMAWLGLVLLVLLDLVDGAVARRFGGSPEGAVLDMEADQLTVVGLSALVVLHGGTGVVLVLPGLRYAFVLAAWWWQVPANEAKPVNGDNRRGRRICAVVMVTLLLALWPGVSRPVADIGIVIAVLLLAWSFAADARHLLNHRAMRRVPA